MWTRKRPPSHMIDTTKANTQTNSISSSHPQLRLCMNSIMSYLFQNILENMLLRSIQHYRTPLWILRCNDANQKVHKVLWSNHLQSGALKRKSLDLCACGLIVPSLGWLTSTAECWNYVMSHLLFSFVFSLPLLCTVGDWMRAEPDYC